MAQSSRKLPPDVMAICTALYLEFDTDSNGWLSREELQVGFTRLGLKLNDTQAEVTESNHSPSGICVAFHDRPFWCLSGLHSVRLSVRPALLCPLCSSFKLAALDAVSLSALRSVLVFVLQAGCP